MIAIPMKAFQELSLALPKCLITAPKENTSWITDKNGEKVGDINWETAQIRIYEEYEFCDQVIESIGKEKFTDARQEFNTETREDHEPLPGEIIGQVMNLYSDPKNT